MKSTKNNGNAPDYSKYTHVLKSYNQFTESLMQAEQDSENESEFDDFLINEIAPKLTQDEQLYDTSVFMKLDIAVELSQSELINRGSSLQDAIREMNVSATCWMIDHLYSIQRILDLFEPYADQKDKQIRIDSLRRDMNELQELLNGDMYERIQAYTYEIKKLRGIA